MELLILAIVTIVMMAIGVPIGISISKSFSTLAVTKTSFAAFGAEPVCGMIKRSSCIVESA